MDLTNFSGRDAIILAVILIAVYLLVSLLRLSQIKRGKKRSVWPVKKAQGAQPESAAESGAPAAGDQAEAAAPSAMTPQAMPAAAGLSFNEQLFRTNVEAELQQLREEVAELRTALAQLKAARRVSPQYNEAMLLAQRGGSAQSIADECAISIGEAELVLALSRNRQEYENYERQYDGRE